MAKDSDDDLFLPFFTGADNGFEDGSTLIRINETQFWEFNEAWNQKELHGGQVYLNRETLMIDMVIMFVWQELD